MDKLEDLLSHPVVWLPIPHYHSKFHKLRQNTPYLFHSCDCIRSVYYYLIRKNAPGRLERVKNNDSRYKNVFLFACCVCRVMISVPDDEMRYSEVGISSFEYYFVFTSSGYQ